MLEGLLANHRENVGCIWKQLISRDTKLFNSEIKIVTFFIPKI